MLHMLYFAPWRVSVSPTMRRLPVVLAVQQTVVGLQNALPVLVVLGKQLNISLDNCTKFLGTVETDFLDIHEDLYTVMLAMGSNLTKTLNFSKTLTYSLFIKNKKTTKTKSTYLYLLFPNILLLSLISVSKMILRIDI